MDSAVFARILIDLGRGLNTSTLRRMDDGQLSLLRQALYLIEDEVRDEITRRKEAAE